MQRVAKFEKVSFEQFKKDWADTFYVTDGIEKIYEDIKLPKREIGRASCRKECRSRWSPYH